MSSTRVAPAALLLVLACSTSACGRTVQATNDPVTTWQRVPMAPDPALAAKATDAANPTSCRPLDAAFPIGVVLQDQRTPSTAAFLLAGGGMTGNCLLSLPGGGASGWSSQPLPAMAAPITIDEQGSGAGETRTALLGGRVAPGIVSVEVALSDGTTVAASVGNGHWLAWWPGVPSADSITGTSADGVATVIEWRDGGWSVR